MYDGQLIVASPSASSNWTLPTTLGATDSRALSSTHSTRPTHNSSWMQGRRPK